MVMRNVSLTVVNIANKHRYLLLLGLVMLVSLPRFLGLGDGLVLGEPDEYIHQEVMEGFKNSLWPEYGGAPWLFQMPLYPFLGYIFSFFLPQRYLALRFVSVLSSMFLILGTYLYFSRRFSIKDGFLTSMILAVSPFSIYISRLALLDSTAVSFGILSLYALDYARASESKGWTVLSGLFISIALMTKYTALIYLIPFLIMLLFDTLKNISWRDLKEGFMKLNLVLLIPIIVLALFVLPTMAVLWFHNSYFFKLQLFTSLGFVRDFWRIKGGELNITYYLGLIPWWLTWPMLVLFIGGVATQWQLLKKSFGLWLGFIMTLVLVLPFKPFYPRYFYPLVPFVAIYAGLFLSSLTGYLGTKTRIALFLVLMAAAIPTSMEAFSSTRHNLVEETGRYIKSYQINNPWIFTNYWPSYFGEASQSENATWLSDSAWDAKAYAPGIQESPLNVLNKLGGFVVLEDAYSRSRMFIHPDNRRDAWATVSKSEMVSKTIIDRSPNFPHFSGSQNRVDVYFIRPRSI